MFFKEDKNHDKKSVHFALLSVFIFWSLALLMMSVLEEFYSIQTNISYLTLLYAGLFVFFASQFIARIRKKNKDN